jgi:hypothetical protein
MLQVGDLVSLTFTDPGAGPTTIQAIITEIDPDHGPAYACKRRYIGPRPSVIMANDAMLRVITSEFVATSRRSLGHLSLPKIRKIARKQGLWWIE